MIISASKRTDIPAFLGNWFVNRLKSGEVLVQNPYNVNRYSKVSLRPKDVDIIVFWTKNPLPFLKYLPEIDKMGYTYYFEFTITPYDRDVEKNLPNKEILIDTFVNLSEKIDKNRMVWRYDPIIFDDKHTAEYHAEKFRYMAKKLGNHTKRCVISFVDNYKSVIRNIGYDPTYELTTENIHKLCKNMSEIAYEHNFEIFTCAERYDLSQFGIKHGACIDKKIIENILGCDVKNIKDKSPRDECLCLESIDIGAYNTCANGCNYCYAVQNEKSAVCNLRKHNEHSPLIFGEINSNAIITERSRESVKVDQLSLF